MPLPYALAQFALAFVNGIAPAKAETFNSRLKQWQKMGFPDGVNVGRGVKAEYGARQVFQLLFMLKLMRVGLTPQRAQEVVRSAWPRLQDAIVETATCIANEAEHLHYCLIQLNALSELSEPPSEHMHVFADVFTSDEIADSFLSFDPDEEIDEETKLKSQMNDYYVKNRLANAISIEIDSMLILLWAAFDAAGVRQDVFAVEMLEWYNERNARGRAPIDAPEFDKGVAARSVRDFQTSLDAVEMARQMLSLVQAQIRADNDSDPQA